MSRETAQRIVTRERLNDPPNPEAIGDLGTMLENWPLAANIYKGQFTASDGSTGVVFYDEIMLRRMSTTTELHLDGTFKCTPRAPRACQLMIVHMRRADVGFPVIFVLCERRTTSVYQAMWSFIKLRAPAIVDHLQTVNCDYERAILSATRLSFGDRVHIRGFWFHFIRALSRKWDKLRLRRDENGNNLLHKAWAIALLPAHHFDAAIGILSDYARQLPLDAAKVNAFMAYLRGFWLRQANIVSVFGSTVRTNNLTEACHRHIVRRLGGVHPSLSTFIPRLADYILKIKLDWQELDAGLVRHRHRQMSQRPRDRHIRHQQDLLQDERINILDFLITAIPRTDREEIQVNLNLQDDNGIDGAVEDEEVLEENLIGPEEPIGRNDIIPAFRVRRQPLVRRNRRENAAVLGPPRRRGRPRRQIPDPLQPQPQQQPQEEQQPPQHAEEDQQQQQQQEQRVQDYLPHVIDAAPEREERDSDEAEENDPLARMAPNVCRICLNALADVVYLPCAHLCSCLGCSEMLRRNHENRINEPDLDEEIPRFLRCPVCRGQVENSLRVFT